MHEVDPLIALSVFASAGALDILAVLYVRRAAEGKSIQAAVISGASIVLGYIVLANALSNYAYIPFEVTGGLIATWATIEADKRSRIKITKDIK